MIIFSVQVRKHIGWQGQAQSLHVKLLALLTPAFAIENIASTMDTDDLEGHLHKSFISITHRHTHLEPAYFPFWSEVVLFFSIFPP